MRIKTIEQLDEGLKEIGGLNLAESQFKAECDEQIQKVKERYARLMVIHIGGEAIPIQDRREELIEAIQLYCEQDKDQLLQGPEKSIRLNHGVVGWRKQKDTIKPIGKKTEKGLLDVIVSAVVNFLVKALNKHVVSESFDTANAVRIDLKWDKAGMIQLYSEGKMTANDLKAFGFKWIPGEEEFYCKADEVAIEGRKTA